jgi:hypothetical protein
MSASPGRALAGNTRPRHQLRRRVALAAVGVAVCLCAAACGGSGGDPSTSRTGHAGSDASAEKAVAYAECMRTHGVTNFPDPGSGNSATSTDVNPSSSTFQSAQAKCYKLRTFGVTSTYATEKQIRQALGTAKCMRGHGVPDFPDPIVTATPPAFGSGAPSGPPSAWGNSGAGYLETYNNGILFKITNSIASSPAFQAAAEACGVAQQFGLSNG